MNLIAPNSVDSNDEVKHFGPGLEEPIVVDAQVGRRYGVRMPGCFRPILKIFELESKGVFRIFGPVLNLPDAEVPADHPAPLNVRCPIPAQPCAETLDFGKGQH